MDFTAMWQQAKAGKVLRTDREKKADEANLARRTAASQRVALISLLDNARLLLPPSSSLLCLHRSFALSTSSTSSPFSAPLPAFPPLPYIQRITLSSPVGPLATWIERERGGLASSFGAEANSDDVAVYIEPTTRESEQGGWWAGERGLEYRRVVRDVVRWTTDEYANITRQAKRGTPHAIAVGRASAATAGWHAVSGRLVQAWGITVLLPQDVDLLLAQHHEAGPYDTTVPLSVALPGRVATPPALTAVGTFLHAAGLLPTPPSQILGNIYDSSAGIFAHTDGPAYAPIVVTLTITIGPGTDERPVALSRSLVDQTIVTTRKLVHASLFVLAGHSYSQRLHSIGDGTGEGGGIRVSYTFRCAARELVLQ